MWQYFLQNSLKKVSLNVNAGNCLRQRYKGHGCRLCVEACPRDALDLVEQQVTVKERQCDSCGLCCHHCPTGALHLESSVLAQFERQVSGKEVACFTCTRQGEEDDILLPCLSALSPEVLMAAALHEVPVQVFWEEEACRQCSLSWDREVLKEWVEAWNETFSFQVSLIHAPGEKEGKPKSMSRRNYFSFARSQLQQQMKSFLYYAYDETLLKDKIPLPAKRQYLRRFLQQEERKKAKVSPVLAGAMSLCRLSVNEACDLCGKCAVLCPTGAMQVEKTPQSKRLHFKPLLCLDCGVCRAHCDKLTKKPPVVSSLAALLKPETLTDCTQNPCPQCGELKGLDKELCLECTIYLQKKQEMLDSWLEKKEDLTAYDER